MTYGLPAARDAVDGDVAVTCAPASGVAFPLGTTTVHCTARDSHHNEATASFTVTVQDTTAPVLVVPADVTAEAASAGGAAVDYPAATAHDAVDGDVTPTCAPASGGTFPLGTTTVHCTARDSHQNEATASFMVTVRDTTPPVIAGVPASLAAEAAGPAGATVTYSNPTASDLVDGSVPVSCSPASGSTFPLGTTTVHCAATDAAGNSATAAFLVTVLDTTPPALSLPADRLLSATGPAGAAATFDATATDTVDGTVPVSCSPPSGSTFPIGTTVVHCTASDHAGNTVSGSFEVTVRRTVKGFTSRST